MPAVKHLRTSIERVLADGRITPEEYGEVYRAVEAVLPFEARKQALARKGGGADTDRGSHRERYLHGGRRAAGEADPESSSDTQAE